jgi:hypothetical protein
MEIPMQRLISLFATVEHEPRLSRPTSGPPPTPDYEREPQYFENLLAYLREQRRIEGELSARPEEVEAEMEAICA